MGLEEGRSGEELFEDGGVLADEFDGAEGKVEGAFDEREREGFGGFAFDEGFERDQGFEVFLTLHRVIQAAVADGLKCAIKDGSEVVALVVGRRRTVPGWGAAGQEEEEPRCSGLRHWWQWKFARPERRKKKRVLGLGIGSS